MLTLSCNLKYRIIKKGVSERYKCLKREYLILSIQHSPLLDVHGSLVPSMVENLRFK